MNDLGALMVLESIRGASLQERLERIRDEKTMLEKRLLQSGALFFSELGVDSPESFASLSDIVCEGRWSYAGGDSPRTQLRERVYTSTEHPAEYAIALHNELSYSGIWPMRLLFACMIPADEGGETPIADSRKILAALDPSLVDEFVHRRVRYIRNLHDGEGFGRSWQETFESDDRSVVERKCADMMTAFEWKSDGGLRLSAVRPAVATHPITGERVWFNQADLFHPSTHPKAVYDSLMELYGDDPHMLPSFATFGDGEPIPLDMLDVVRRTITELSVTFPWRRGDALLLDNMLMCHGRTSYCGKRQILVSMA
jgi:alpha-ketoglutarate-dependent taurine dioxygenase